MFPPAARPFRRAEEGRLAQSPETPFKAWRSLAQILTDEGARTAYTLAKVGGLVVPQDRIKTESRPHSGAKLSRLAEALWIIAQLDFNGSRKRNAACRFSSVTTMSTKPFGC